MRKGLILATLLVASPAFAGGHGGTTRGSNTYYTDGTTIHRAPNGDLINEKTREVISVYGSHAYSNTDGSWRAKHDDGSVTSYLHHEPTTVDAGVDRIFGNESGGKGGGGNKAHNGCCTFSRHYSSSGASGK